MLILFLTTTLCCVLNVLSMGLNLENNACTNLLSYPIAAISPDCYNNPDVLSDVPTIGQRHNYSITPYSVTTADGYILTVFRVTSKRNVLLKYPVFIQHGINTNSVCWTDIGNRSLAFNLADLGYDVWLGNVRGTAYSNRHVRYTVNDSNYWEFNLDTVAKYDISAQLNLVADETGSSGNILYIGHSMGTTLSFMYASAYYTEASHLLQGIISLAPVVYLKDVTALESVLPVVNPLLELLKLLKIWGVFYQGNAIYTKLTLFCKRVPRLCREALNLFFGDTVQFVPEDLLLYFSYWPDGSSVSQLKQYLQFVSGAQFQKYDYGPDGNLKSYGSLTPPLYQLSNIKVPVNLFYGVKDSLYNEANLNRLYDELGSTDKFKHRVPANNATYDFNHIDFIYSGQMHEFLYSDLFNVITSQFG